MHPDQLKEIDLFQRLVLESENPEVLRKAMRFYISMFMSIEQDELVFNESANIAENFISKLFVLISDNNPSPELVERVMLILNNVISISELRGIGDAKPHNALQQGDLLERIIINNLTSPKAENIIIRLRTSASIFEFREQVSKLINLSP